MSNMSNKKTTDSLKMLLAMDGSPHSKAALQFIQQITFPTGTLLYLLTVVDIPDKSTRRNTITAIKSIRTQETDKAWKTLNQQRDRLQSPGRSVTSVVKHGTPGGEILKTIDKHEIDLVVLGTHGRRGLNRFLLGSVSEWVLSEAPCSTLIVRPKSQTKKSKEKGLRILLASDGSPDAQAALNVLRCVNFPPSSRLTLLHVVKKHFYQTEQLVTTTEQTETDMDRMAEVLMKERGRKGTELLHDITSEFTERGLTVKEHLAFGSPADEILKCAKRTRSDLIILGSRGLTGMRKLLLGSVSNKVARHAPCSVLIVRKN